jgi:copper chaperone CopZ
MKLQRWAISLSFVGAAFLVGAARAETKVELKGVHLCCAACEKAVGSILKGVDGVKAACDRKNRTVTITATHDQSAQKALDALAAAGFYGTTDNKDLVIKQENPATGKVKSLSISGIHNCCGACCYAIKQATRKVDGVTADTAKPKANSFKVTGDFDAAELVKALNAAGFHVKVDK